MEGCKLVMHQPLGEPALKQKSAVYSKEEPAEVIYQIPDKQKLFISHLYVCVIKKKHQTLSARASRRLAATLATSSS
jgi:hypothetical protein